MTDALAQWNARLATHFAELHRQRCACGSGSPVFALEHGLELHEVSVLASIIKAQIDHGSLLDDHALPWIVYAAEIGYGYSGDEYWQTFERETPGWAARGDRYWIREQYQAFHREYGGAMPTGAWADHFSIICWPITHAILPRDLQRQLARILYDLRHSFSAELFDSPPRLGEFIAARSWNATSRFQNLAQETLLLGQIAAALLLQGEDGTGTLIHPLTLTRISSDLDRERRARDWLRGARNFATKRAAVRGLGVGRTTSSTDRSGQARSEVEELGIEPRLVLRPTVSSPDAWEVSLEIPDLSHLLLRFPSARDCLANSRCIVAGSAGRPIARGRFLYGSQRVALSRWPRPDEVLLQFECEDRQLEYLLRAECLLRPGPMWLFRIASDGLAYEMRSLRVRPGESYVLVCTAPGPERSRLARPVSLECDNVGGVRLDLPNALTTEWEDAIRTIGLGQAKTIEVWPAGLAAIAWDGEGRGEWLASERPCLAICTDHPVAALAVSLDDRDHSQVDLTTVTPGEPVFVELPELAIGLHRVHICTRSSIGAGPEPLGELDIIMRVRESRPWSSGVSHNGPLMVEVDPPTPTLEQLWEGHADFTLRGPEGRRIRCTASLSAVEDDDLIALQLPALVLPVTPSSWRTYFERHFREKREVAGQYDLARACELTFTAEELGKFTLRCERGFAPLRWAVRRTRSGFTLRLFDDSGIAEPVVISWHSFARPCESHLVAAVTELDVHPDGGLYTAHQGAHVAGVVVPPASPGLGDLRCDPSIDAQVRSIQSLVQVVALAELWGDARLPGDLLSAIMQRDVLRSLTQLTMLLIGGERWHDAEATFLRTDGNLELLAHAVSRRRDEAAVGVILKRDADALATEHCSQRVERLASIAQRFRLVPRRLESKQDETYDSAAWYSELALRLASSPTGVRAWAGDGLDEGLRYLLEDSPTLARGARFLVLAIDERLKSTRDPTALYSGWEWE